MAVSSNVLIPLQSYKAQEETQKYSPIRETKCLQKPTLKKQRYINYWQKNQNTCHKDAQWAQENEKHEENVYFLRFKIFYILYWEYQ